MGADDIESVVADELGELAVGRHVAPGMDETRQRGRCPDLHIGKGLRIGFHGPSGRSDKRHVVLGTVEPTEEFQRGQLSPAEFELCDDVEHTG